MRELIKKESLLQNIGLGSLLTDETFALSMNKLNQTNQQLYVNQERKGGPIQVTSHSAIPSQNSTQENNIILD